MTKAAEKKTKRLSLRRKPKTVATMTFSEEKLRAEIIAEAKILKVSESTAEIIAEKTAAAVAKWVAKRAAVTIDDVNRRVALEVVKYNSDLAYVYQNRDKII